MTAVLKKKAVGRGEGVRGRCDHDHRFNVFLLGLIMSYRFGLANGGAVKAAEEDHNSLT